LTQAEKEFIEETAKRLPGVRSVHNHLRVTTRR
jgi:osmotically-inducible protein OsmY